MFFAVCYLKFFFLIPTRKEEPSGSRARKISLTSQGFNEGGRLNSLLFIPKTSFTAQSFDMGDLDLDKMIQNHSEKNSLNERLKSESGEIDNR